MNNTKETPPTDLWLEEINGKDALAWVNDRNRETKTQLENDPLFPVLKNEIHAIFTAKDRVPSITLVNGFVYNFWQDTENPRGVFRRTTLKEYRKANPTWEILLDVDALAKSEGENWSWQSTECLLPQMNHCLFFLSRGGADASVMREFDLNKKEFVKNGFSAPEALTFASWIDPNTILIASNFGPESLSSSNYPLHVKIWRRGTTLAQAETIFRGQPTDMNAYGKYFQLPGEQERYFIFTRALSFYESDTYIGRTPENLQQVPLPADADVITIFQGRIIARIRSDLIAGDKKFPAGSLLALPIAALAEKENFAQYLEPVFLPTATTVYSGLVCTQSRLVLSLLDQVKGRIEIAHFDKGKWSRKRLKAEAQSSDTIATGYVGNYCYDAETKAESAEQFLIRRDSFTKPFQSLIVNSTRLDSAMPLKRGKPRFNAAGMRVEQRFATSKDGTKIPYFLVLPKGFRANGKTPTLVYAYGGFELSEFPFYLNQIGKVWSERGGAYVVANIRGGAEFGPSWHKAVLRENRVLAFADLEAVLKDLIATQVSSPAHLGISGQSNGGLLVGAVLTRSPELMNAVVAEIPLFDMLRFHKLLAGPWWVSEYGDPENSKDRQFLAAYSPLHNLKRDAKYPPPFILTNTKDDRVHPGHARRMVERLRALGHPVLYYENTDGGHGQGINPEDKVRWNALKYTYLWQRLGGSITKVNKN